MKLTKLTLEGVGAYQHPCTLDLSGVSLAVVTGDNGAGKSTLLDALLWGLFGHVEDRQTGELVNEHSDSCAVEIEFTHRVGACGAELAGHDRHTVQVSRSFSTRRSAAAKAALVCCGQEVATRVTSTRDTVTTMLGGDAQVLCSTMLARQFDAGRFNSARNTDRQKMLQHALPQNEFDNEHRQAMTALDAVEEPLRAAMFDANSARRALQVLPDLQQQLDTCRAAADAAQQRLAELQALPQVDHARVNYLRLQVAQGSALREVLADGSRKVQQLKDDLVVTRGQHMDAVQEHKIADEVMLTTRTDAQEAAAARDAARDDADVARDRLRTLEAGSVTECWTCGQTLTRDHVGGLRTELGATIDKHEHLKAAADKKSREAAAAESVEQNLDRKADDIEDEMRNIEQAIDAASREMVANQQSLDTCEAAEDELRDLEERAARAPSKQMMDAALTEVAAASEALGAATARYDEASEQAGRVDELQQIYADLQAESDGLSLLRKATGRSGIPQIAGIHLLRAVTDHANLVLARLNSTLNIRLGGADHTDLIAASGTATPDEMVDRMIVEGRTGPQQPWRTYATFSGGERLRMDIATRLALAQVLGVRCDLLVVDEGWGTLDEAGRSSFAQLLGDLVRTQEVSQVLTISHVLETVDAFDTQVEVTRTPQGSVAVLSAPNVYAPTVDLGEDL